MTITFEAITAEQAKVATIIGAEETRRKHEEALEKAVKRILDAAMKSIQEFSSDGLSSAQAYVYGESLNDTSLWILLEARPYAETILQELGYNVTIHEYSRQSFKKNGKAFILYLNW